MTIDEKKTLLKTESRHSMDSLLTLVEVLRSEEGCPWDREQTHMTIRNDLIEETYEVVEAIDKDDRELLKEELGDVLFQVIFHAQIEREKGSFTIDDIIGGIVDKMILRHPHVFGDVTVSGSCEVLENWEQIKKKEKSRKTVRENMEAVPKELPSLMRARKIAKKAKKDGYSFNITDDSLADLIEKLKTAAPNEREAVLTDIIFASVVLAGDEGDLERKLGEKIDNFIEDYKETGEQ